MATPGILQWIESTDLSIAIREGGLPYPIIGGIHLLSIAWFGGMLVATDLRLLGLAMTDCTVTDVVSQFRNWKRVGFCIMVTMGILLGTSEAVKYAANPFFWAKMTCLVLVAVHAAIFRPLVYNNTAAIDKALSLPGTAKWAGALSLVLWLSILTFGRLIGYYEGPGSPGRPAARATHSTMIQVAVVERALR